MTTAPTPATSDPDFTTPILDLIRDVAPDPDNFLDTPNTLFGLRPPRDLLATPEGEMRVRQVVLAYKYGDFT